MAEKQVRQNVPVKDSSTGVTRGLKTLSLGIYTVVFLYSVIPHIFHYIFNLSII